MGNELRAGLVGCGSVSQRGILPHLSLPDAQASVRLVAVADAVEERARQSAERFGVPAYFSRIEDMLEHVDLVLVATPIQYHFANAIAAVEAGKHVYVQKTMTTTLAEANELLAARDRHGVKLAAAPGFELCSTIAEMRRQVQDGTLGRVNIAYTYTMGFGHEHETIRSGSGALAEIDPRWYYRPGAGPLPDVTVYALQLITSVLGPVRRVTALGNKSVPERTWRGSTIHIDVDDNNLVLMEFVAGALAVAVGSDCVGSGRIPWGGLGLYGTEGRLEVLDVNNESGYPLSFVTERPAQEAAPQGYSTRLSDQPYVSGEHLCIEEPHVYADIMDLADAVRHDKPPRASGEQARHVVEIIERVHEAVRTGQTQVMQSAFTPRTVGEGRGF